VSGALSRLSHAAKSHSAREDQALGTAQDMPVVASTTVSLAFIHGIPAMNLRLEP